MNTDIRLSITFFDHIRAAGFTGITQDQYAEYIQWKSGFCLTNAPAPAPIPIPTPTPKRKYRAEKDQRRSKTVDIVDNPRRGERF